MLDRYELLAPAGRGASGTVWKVRDIRTDTSCALKVGTTLTLLDELAHLSHLVHPSLPTVIEVGRTDHAFDGVAAETPCFVSRWIDGGRADQRTWDAAALVRIAGDLAGAIAAIHEAGLVHGDVAPQNVLVDDTTGRAMLVDLGFARRIDGVAAARGTPAYMAPEALAGHALPSGDLWGLGAVLVRLATGNAPFGDGRIGEVVHRAMTAPRPVVLELGAALADLVGRLLAVDPDARPASATAVVDELADIAATRPHARRADARSPPPVAWPGAAAWLDELGATLDRGTAVEVVVGDAGSGASELVATAVRRWQVARIAAGRAAAAIIGSLDDVAVALGVANVGERGFATRLARAARASGRLVAVDLTAAAVGSPGTELEFAL